MFIFVYCQYRVDICMPFVSSEKSSGSWQSIHLSRTAVRDAEDGLPATRNVRKCIGKHKKT